MKRTTQNLIEILSESLIVATFDSNYDHSCVSFETQLRWQAQAWAQEVLACFEVINLSSMTDDVEQALAGLWQITVMGKTPTDEQFSNAATLLDEAIEDARRGE